jgi:hypothetical protein
LAQSVEEFSWVFQEQDLCCLGAKVEELRVALSWVWDYGQPEKFAEIEVHRKVSSSGGRLSTFPLVPSLSCRS